MWSDTLFLLGMDQMSQQQDGIMSNSLKSLQLQLVALFEGVGGGKAVKLLDSLSEFSQDEQHKIIEMFCGVLQKIAPSAHTALDKNEEFVRTLEEQIYQDIMLTIEGHEVKPHVGRLTLVKSQPKNDKVVDIATKRQRKSSPPVLRPIA